MADNEKLKIIYISGLGRSGSTLLDMVISTSDLVFSIGEIYRYNEIKNKNTICSCGKNFNECGFWNNFSDSSGDFRIVNRVNLRDYLAIINYLYNPFKKKISFKKKSENGLLFSKLNMLIKQKGAKYILDSSKEIGRLIELNENPDVDLYNINVIRDGRAAANSFNRKKLRGGPGKNYFISLFKWILMNILIRKYIKKSKIKSLHISYEAFCENPDKYLKRIQDFLNIKIPPDYTEKIRTMDYHNPYGNPSRTKVRRMDFTGIKCDEKWKIEQPKYIKSLATIIAKPFNKAWVSRNND